MNLKKTIVLTIVGLAIAVAAVIGVSEGLVKSNASGRMYTDVDAIPHRKVGLVLGTSPISTWNGRRNHYFDHRISAAAKLYNGKKVDRLIVSGGDYRQEGGYDEPVAMRDSLMKQGVPSDDIVLDYNGTRTLNSIAKAKDIYNVDSITLISQAYHDERALYQAKYVGIDAIAYVAPTPARKRSWIRNRGRECLARVKLFVDIARGVKPDIKETAVAELRPEVSDLLAFENVSTQHGDLLCIIPDMQRLRIDLACGHIPNANNDSTVLAFAGAFTGKLGDKGHGNIAGDHVASGKLYKGYPCKRNTGAFTWSEQSGPSFVYQDYAQSLDQAAAEGGMGFTQEMMIHNGVAVKTTRPLGNKNQFRALCMLADGRLAVIESRGTVAFGNFINALLEHGATEALYTDMGPGWNYCFYRQQQGQPASFLHDQPEINATNFIILTLR